MLCMRHGAIVCVFVCVYCLMYVCSCVCLGVCVCMSVSSSLLEVNIHLKLAIIESRKILRECLHENVLAASLESTYRNCVRVVSCCFVCYQSCVYLSVNGGVFACNRVHDPVVRSVLIYLPFAYLHMAL